MKHTPRLYLSLFLVLFAFAAAVRAQILVSDSAGTISQYNATGALMNGSFITGLGTGAPYGYPEGLVVSGSNLFVASWYGTVSEYNADTGAAVNLNYITGLNVDSVTGIAFSGSTLYFSLYQGAIKTRNSSGVISSFISTGVIATTGSLALSGNRLFAIDSVNHLIREYDATTGAAVATPFVSGLTGESGLTAYGSFLFVGSATNHTVSKYDINTGALLDANVISGMSDNYPAGIAVVAIPEPSTYALVGGLGALSVVLLRRRQRAI